MTMVSQSESVMKGSVAGEVDMRWDQWRMLFRVRWAIVELS